MCRNQKKNNNIIVVRYIYIYIRGIIIIVLVEARK